jgi:hypothetical protein
MGDSTDAPFRHTAPEAAGAEIGRLYDVGAKILKRPPCASSLSCLFEVRHLIKRNLIDRGEIVARSAAANRKRRESPPPLLTPGGVSIARKMSPPRLVYGEFRHRYN